MAGRNLALLLLTVMLLAACASRGGGPGTYPPVPQRVGSYKLGQPYVVAGRRYVPRFDPAYDEVGIASWYGPGFHGRPTANGEIFDARRYTAAHPTLPLPSLVEVTNLENGRKLVVRVNDRGPFRPGRIIDLSEAAARALGFREQGIARVRVRFLRLAEARGTPPRPVPPRRPRGAVRPPACPPGALLVQVGAFADSLRARAHARRLTALGPVRIEWTAGPRGRLGRVQLLVSEPEKLPQLLARLATMGYDNPHLRRSPVACRQAGSTSMGGTT